VRWEHASLTTQAGLLEFSFMLEARGPQGAMGNVAASEPTSARRRDSEPQDTWQYRISSQS
jgi:hypothetical protein